MTHATRFNFDTCTIYMYVHIFLLGFLLFAVCQTQISQLHDASAVLIRFILFRLPKVSVYEIKWLLVALKMLCEGRENAANGSGSAQFDYNSVAAVLKSAKHPESTSKSISSSSSNSSAGGGSGAGTEKESPKSEIKRSRSDLSTVILQQLLAPLEPGKMTWVPLSEEISDCTVSTK